MRRSPWLGYLVLTFSWCWACRAMSPAIRPQPPWLATLLMFAGSFGPSLVAVLIMANNGGVEGLQTWLSRCLQWRIGAAWWAFALLLPLAVMVLAAGLHPALFFIVGTSQAMVPPGLFLPGVVAIPAQPASTLQVLIPALWQLPLTALHADDP